MSLSPVFYTLAQVQFNPITQMTEYVSPLQEHLRRSGFPDYRADSQIEFAIRRLDELQPDVQQQQHIRWSFTNSDRTEGYQLSGNTLVFHTTIYDTFQDFLEKTILGLELVHEVVELAYVERIGLRYLDAIVPIGDDTLKQYLNPSLLGLSDSIVDGQLAHSFTETVKLIGNGTLVTRAVIANNVLSLSPDLFPLQLELAPEFKKINGCHAVLDTDYFVAQRTNFDIAEIRSKLLLAHDVVTNAFDCSVTEYSKKKWA
jgi:uncharacterized protein (TIGR04255 family)